MNPTCVVALMLVGATVAHAESPNIHAPFDDILAAGVKNDRVDYDLIRTKLQPSLNQYLDALAHLRIADLPRAGQLASYINLYNATMIKAVIDRYHDGYSPAEKDYAVFKDPIVREGGEKVSLNDLENKIIRPTFKDPRIHVALVCGARSCPPILPRAYRGEDLDAVLEENMRRFVNDASRNPIDREHKRLRLSKIFDWYAEDFGGKDAVVGYVQKYLDFDVKGWPVEFVEYSWDLNDTKH